jgi:hypothetical protein
MYIVHTETMVYYCIVLYLNKSSKITEPISTSDINIPVRLQVRMYLQSAYIPFNPVCGGSLFTTFSDYNGQ